MAKAVVRYKRDFQPYELSQKAWEWYSDNSSYFWEDREGFWISDTVSGKGASFIGSRIDDVNLFFEDLYDLGF